MRALGVPTVLVFLALTVAGCSQGRPPGVFTPPSVPPPPSVGNAISPKATSPVPAPTRARAPRRALSAPQ